MSTLTDQYDVIVIGDSVGALVAATTAANDRARTLWIPHERRTWSVHSGGYNFPVEEGLVTGMAPGGAFAMLCEGTGLHPSEAMKFRALEPALQLITPEIRLSLPTNRDDLKHELQLECRGDADAAERFLERADALRRSVDTWIAHLVRADDDDIPPPPNKDTGKSPECLDDALRALLVGVAYTTDPTALAPYERARALGVFRAGVFAPAPNQTREDDAQVDTRRRVASGAALAIRHLLAARARHTPMTILRQNTVAAIRARWGTVRGVRLDDDRRIESKTVITALDASDDVPVEGALGRKRAGIHDTAAARTYTAHLIVEQRVFPVGMGPRAVLVRDPGQPMVGANHVVVSRDPVDDDLERVALSVRVPIGASEPERKQILRDAIDALHTVVPFLDDGLRGVFPPLGTEHDLEPDRKQTDPWTISRGPVVTAEPHEGSLFGERFTTPVKHLLKTGSASLPGFGYEGELLAGVAAGRRALRVLHKN